MDDQVWALKKLGIDAQMLCSSTEKGVSSTIYKKLSESGTCRFENVSICL
jgi:superfamily II DNA helicase RecQ